MLKPLWVWVPSRATGKSKTSRERERPNIIQIVWQMITSSAVVAIAIRIHKDEKCRIKDCHKCTSGDILKTSADCEGRWQHRQMDWYDGATGNLLELGKSLRYPSTTRSCMVYFSMQRTKDIDVYIIDTIGSDPTSYMIQKCIKWCNINTFHHILWYSVFVRRRVSWVIVDIYYNFIIISNTTAIHNCSNNVRDAIISKI